MESNGVVMLINIVKTLERKAVFKYSNTPLVLSNLNAVL